MKMKVLITHEESQTVMEAFLNAGHDAYSCDLLPASGKYPERHLQMDCFEAIKLIEPDFLGMHPECTRLTVAANKYYKPEYAERFPNIHEQRAEAVEHFLKCTEALEQIGCGYIENPIGIMSRLYKKPTQIIQPYQFGHTERKSTCLWLAGLPKLEPTKIVEPDIIIHKSGRTDSRLHYETFKLPKEERRKARSKTFTGIAEGMASQWSDFLINNSTNNQQIKPMTKDLQQKKEQLKKQLKKIKDLERKKLIEKHYPKFKKLEGNCYKKKNHYGSPKKPSDYWFTYTKVLEIKAEDIFYDNMGNKVLSRFRGVSFDKFGIRQDNSYVHLLGKKITEKEFNKAFNNQLSRAKKLLTK